MRESVLYQERKGEDEEEKKKKKEGRGLFPDRTSGPDRTGARSTEGVPSGGQAHTSTGSILKVTILSHWVTPAGVAHFCWL